MKHLKRFNESRTDKINDFYNEYVRLFDDEDVDDGDEMSNSDIINEVGDLVNKYNLDEDDIKWIIDNKDISFDFIRALKITYDNTIGSDDISDSSFTRVDLQRAFSAGVQIGADYGEDGEQSVYADFNKWFDEKYRKRRT